MNASSPIPSVTGIDNEQPFGPYETTHDWSGDVPLSTTILSLVTEASDADVEDLPSLNDAVDPDALDALFGPRECGTRRPPGSISFRFAGFLVDVGKDGAVVVRPV